MPKNKRPTRQTRDNLESGAKPKSGRKNVAKDNLPPNITFIPSKKGDGSGSYRVTFTYDRLDGKTPRKYKTYKTLDEAIEALEVFEAQKKLGQLAPFVKVTFGEYAKNFIHHCGKSPATIYSYNSKLKHIADTPLYKKKLSEISRPDVQRCIDIIAEKKNKMGEKQTLGKKSFEHIRNLIHRVFEEAAYDGLITANPCHHIRLPNTESKSAPKGISLTRDELIRLAIAIDNETNIRLKTAIALAFYAGLRREEVCGLRWSDIDFNNRIVNIRHARTMAGKDIIEKDPKTVSSARLISIANGKLWDILEENKLWQENNRKKSIKPYGDDPQVIVDRNGYAVLPNYISTNFKSFLSPLGIKMRFHDLRHNFGSISSDGVGSRHTSQTLGHANPGITNRLYSHGNTESSELSTAYFSNHIDELIKESAEDE